MKVYIHECMASHLCPTCETGRMLMARDGLEHTHAVSLGVDERDILANTGNLQRVAEHFASRVCEFPDRFLDIVDGDHDGWMLPWPIGPFLEKPAVNRAGCFGTLLVGFRGRGNHVLAHILAKHLRLPT